MVANLSQMSALAPPPAMKPRSRPRRRLLLAALIACGLQVPLFWSFAEAATGQGARFECADLTGPRSAEMSPRRRLALETRCGPPKETRIKGFLEPKPEMPENTQIVDVSHMPEVKNPTPIVTPHLSDKTTRTEKETRATAQKSEPPAQAERAPETTPEKQREQKPRTQPKTEVGEAKKPELEDFPKVSDAGSMRVEKPKAVVDENGEPSEKSGLLSPVRGSSSALKNYKALNPDGTSDHLPDIEEGDRTVLNANSYRFADYFLQMKRAVERQWRPGEVYLSRDPTGEVYGVKDRYSVLRVTLDGKGNVVELVTGRQSGLDFMDAEAKRAMRDAGPYPNPPEGLADSDGMIRFEFGFFFEVSNGRGRFNWRRL